MGVNAVDYSGYPDCRPEYISAFEHMANLATKAGVEGRTRLKIHTPLIQLSKSEIIRRGLDLGVDYAVTSTCYDPTSQGESVRSLRRLPSSFEGICRQRRFRSCRLLRRGTFRTMKYSVKEIIYTLQGEGANAGHGAVFCRFSGCNLWSGREEDRATAVCKFCDTDFVGINGEGGGHFSSAAELAEAISNSWNVDLGSSERPLVVFTGGEPLLQLDENLINAVHSVGFMIAVETYGTLTPPPGIDWICVSPKAGTVLRLRAGKRTETRLPSGWFNAGTV